MRLERDRLTTTPTDLANFLACARKTSLDRCHAEGLLDKPAWDDPLADALRELGLKHEARYVAALRSEGLRVVDLTGERDGRPLADAMRAGADVIVQAPLSTDGWFGYADVLRRVDQPSALGAWSYEVHDTKLSRETRGGTIVQLCAYTDMLSVLQGWTPEFFRVVTPEHIEAFRFEDYAAFYRHVRGRFRAALAAERAGARVVPSGAPDAVEHCELCRWWDRCDCQRRNADHLSFVAGLGRAQQKELETQGVRTMAALGAMPVPIPFRPTRGSSATYVRLRDQARVQVEQRTGHSPVHELLPLDRATSASPPTNVGLARLPDPSAGDLFLDLEGDPFAREGGREYLFGLGRVAPGPGGEPAFEYRAYWAFDDAEEQGAFEAVVDEISATLAAHPDAHVYHFAPYEPAAFKRLMGRYSSRAAEIDGLLRGERFVDLYWVVRHALRAGVESYSIKQLEPFYGFRRAVPLARAGSQRRIVELGLETHDLSAITPAVREAVQGYNQDDCRSTLELRRWLEELRRGAIAEGTDIPRPTPKASEPSEQVGLRQARVDELRGRLLAGVPAERANRSNEDQARHLIAYALDWHAREDKSSWWEYFRLRGLSDEELLDEPAAVSGLELVADLRAEKKSRVYRYRYPTQEMEIRRGADLKLQDGVKWGNVVAVDRVGRTLDVLVGPTRNDLRPRSAFSHKHFSKGALEDALFDLGQSAVDGLPDSAVTDLLLRRPPRLVLRPDRESETSGDGSDAAVAVVERLDRTTLAIQGPPGSGKTFTGGRMICQLVTQGRKVGVVATSHAVIRNLLTAVAKEAATRGLDVRLGWKSKGNSDSDESGDGGEGDTPVIVEFNDNESARAALSRGDVDVLGGTAWLWAPVEFENSVDVLFVDEAGQMSLANVLAVARAASSLVLLGDPQQLEQPQKGTHPDGVDASALQHVLGPHKTMPREQGLFLPETWRLAPEICAFTSGVFYEGKLHSREELKAQRLEGNGRFEGAGLWIEPVAHEGCRNASDEEVAVVEEIVRRLVAPGSTWIDKGGVARQLRREDIKVVSPYNAQVSRLSDRLGEGIAVGTVDRFQGQEAPIVIYSMATSTPEEAPRGMEFLYSLNRLNVATSRARCGVILVASPRLFEPECRTPRQMQLANALCRYAELAHAVATPSGGR